jgi:hypothetical protein
MVKDESERASFRPFVARALSVYAIGRWSPDLYSTTSRSHNPDNGLLLGLLRECGASLHQTRNAAAMLEPTCKHAHRLLVLDPRHLLFAYYVSPSGSRGGAGTCGGGKEGRKSRNEEATS